MPGPCQVDNVRVALLNQAVKVDVDEVEAGRSAPMAQEARLHVIRLQRRPQQRVLPQVNLGDRQVVGSGPIALYPVEVVGGQGACWAGGVTVVSTHNAGSADVEPKHALAP